MLSETIQWLNDNIIEVFGAIAGLLYLYFAIRQNIWLWPLGLVSSALYVYIFFVARLYADMGLYIYYVIISVYGWYHWQYGGETNKKNALKISVISRKRIFILLFITFGIYWILVCLLKMLPGLFDVPASELLYWDAFTTSASIIATWMLAKKILQHWIIWIVVDAVSCGLYLYKGLYPTVILFFVYTAFSVKGYLEWKKDLNIQKTTD